MHEVAVEDGKILVAFMTPSSSARIATSSLVPPGRAVQAPNQFLPPRFGRKCRSLASSSADWACQASIACDSFSRSGPVIVNQRFEEGGSRPSSSRWTIAVENLARDRGSGRFPAAGPQRVAQFNQIRRVLLSVRRPGTAKQGAATLGNRRKKIGKEGVVMAERDPGRRNCTRFKPERTTIKRS